MRPPVVVDLDGSVGALPGERRLPMAPAQEALRFGCTRRTLARQWRHVEARLPVQHGPVFVGSGDFHHLSLPLIARAAVRHPGLRVLVLDNHPDNMRYPFGVHCGSWVSAVAALPGVARVDVAGITSQDLAAAHAWELRLGPLARGRLAFWSIGVDTGWARRLGLGAAFRGFDTADALVQELTSELHAQGGHIYLSIDKDVFSADTVHTNWDQGVFEPRHAAALIAALGRRVVGSDLCGEVSQYRYASRFKRLLSRLDGQSPDIDAATLRAWQAGQHALNLALLPQLDAAAAP